jgi:hypothetical protein
MALAVLVPLFSAGVLLAWSRGWLPRRTWSLVLALQVVLLGSSLLAMRSGEEAEEEVEHVVAERLIEPHEEAAEVFLWGSGLLLALGLLPLLVREERKARIAGGVAVIGSCAVLFLGYRVGARGGELVYRYGAAAAYTQSPGLSPTGLPSERGPEDD